MKGIIKAQSKPDISQLQSLFKSMYSNNPLALKYLDKAHQNYQNNMQNHQQSMSQNADPNPALSNQHTQIMAQLQKMAQINNITFQSINTIFLIQAQVKQEFNRIGLINQKLQSFTRSGQIAGTEETMDLIQKLDQSKQTVSDLIKKIQAESEKMFDQIQGISV